jgi:enoyl-CoA hydratase/carnithine racemase
VAYETILLEKRDRVATIVLNRPEVLNALTWKMLEEIEEAAREAERDESVMVLVVTGAGERAFCAGIDVAEVQGQDMLAARACGKRIHATDDALRTLEKPVIAKVRGLCLGAGLELAVSCDLIVAADDARFGFPHMRIGIPSIVEAGILPQAIGIFRTKELCFTADYWDARKAEQAGLVNRVVPVGDLDREVAALAAKLCQWSPLAMAIQKDIIHKWMTTDLEAAIDFSINSVAINFASQDQKEGMAAFLEKRRPVFKGK